MKSSSTVASRRTAASSASGADFKLSTERLEVLVMQLTETQDEKEAATIVLEFALRIKNHELVVQGADLSIINAMRRFSNSSKIHNEKEKELLQHQQLQNSFFLRQLLCHPTTATRTAICFISLIIRRKIHLLPLLLRMIRFILLIMPRNNKSC